MYFVQMAEQDSKEISGSYKTHYDLFCYDLDVQKQWSVQFNKYIFSVAFSPDGNTIFVGDALKDELAYAPGHLVMLNKFEMCYEWTIWFPKMGCIYLAPTHLTFLEKFRSYSKNQPDSND